MLDEATRARLLELVGYLGLMTRPDGTLVELLALPPDDPLAPLYQAAAALQADRRAREEAHAAALARARADTRAAERKWLAAEEKLNELHLDFVRVQEDAETRLHEVESLLEGPRLLTKSLDSGQVSRGMLRVLRNILDFEEVFVLSATPAGTLEVIATSSPLFAGTEWTPQRFFYRVLAGKSLAAFDVAQVPEWSEQGAKIQAAVTSALHIPLRSGDRGAMLICTHPDRGYFTRKHIALAERFSLLATHALRNAELYIALKEERDLLDQRVKERTVDLEQARDEALAASRLKSELMAKVNHELRTPLNAILGYAEMLIEELDGPLTPEQKQTVERILVNGSSLLEYINDLLDQAQIEGGMIRLEFSLFHPATLLEGVLGSLEVLAEGHGLALHSHIADNVPRPLRGDMRRLRQVLTNLVANAIKFTDEGSVTVRLLRADADHWMMEIEDTGPGIPPEAQQYIFEPFRQVDGSITRRHGGVGLGLSIVKQLVILMGGTIHLHSEPGHGTTFTVILPLEPG